MDFLPKMYRKALLIIKKKKGVHYFQGLISKPKLKFNFDQINPWITNF